MMRKLKESDLHDHRQYAGKVKRLAIALTCHGYSMEEAEAFISSAKGILDRDKAGLGRWFRENLPRLEDRPDLKAICEDCACCLGGKRESAARQIFTEGPDLPSRVERLLRTPLIIGCRGEVVDDRTFMVHFFPQMEYYMCPCLRFGPGVLSEPMPESYCYCCCGHLRHHVQKALGHMVEVELISSSLTSCGKAGCVFRIMIGEEI